MFVFPFVLLHHQGSLFFLRIKKVGNPFVFSNEIFRTKEGLANKKFSFGLPWDNDDRNRLTTCYGSSDNACANFCQYYRFWDIWDT